MKPLYDHDCSECVFLGTFNQRDLYFCKRGGIGGGTVVARNSSDGPDYISGMHFAQNVKTLANDRLGALRVAYLIAKDEDLID